MFVESNLNLRDVRKFEASRVMIFNDRGQPVLLVTQMGQQAVDIKIAGDDGFEEAVSALGVSAPIVERASLPRAGQVVI